MYKNDPNWIVNIQKIRLVGTNDIYYVPLKMFGKIVVKFTGA